MTTISLETTTLIFQAQAVQQRLATYPEPVAAPWRHLVETVIQCAGLAPQIANWHEQLTLIGDLIAVGAVEPSLALLAEPRFHAHLAEYVCSTQAVIEQHGAELSTERCADLVRAVAACETLRRAYEAGQSFLPYLHAILTLRALEWRCATEALRSRQGGGEVRQ